MNPKKVRPLRLKAMGFRSELYRHSSFQYIITYIKQGDSYKMHFFGSQIPTYVFILILVFRSGL